MDNPGPRPSQQGAAGRTLVLLRHAKSDWSSHEPDRERPLATRGRRQAPVAGRWLVQNIGVFDLVVLSPAVRARSTWDLVAAQLGAPVRVRVDDRVYAASVDDLLAVVRDLPEEAHTAVLVGHNPGLEELVPRLTGKHIAMKTSAVAVIKLSGGWTTTERSPAELVAAGRPPDPIGTRTPIT